MEKFFNFIKPLFFCCCLTQSKNTRTMAPPQLEKQEHIEDEEKDKIVWQEYLSNVLKKRGAEWRPLFTACSESNS